MRSFFGAAAGVLACAGGAFGQGYVTANETVLPNAPGGFGVVGNNTIMGNGSAVGADGKYTISAEGIRANFIPYGASISNLFINDTNGIERDVVLGFDNATAYTLDRAHPHLGGVPGRYANRIKNSTFNIDGTQYYIYPNENNNNDTLHGGPQGWDWRNWTVVTHTTDSITFSLTDFDGTEGFPGEVVSFVTYTLTPYEWHIRMSALSLTKSTPIMLSSHTYWNLDGFGRNDTNLVLNHTFHLPYSGQYIDADNILIPTGKINNIPQGSVMDFWSAPKRIGANFTAPGIFNQCGYGCIGYDNAWLVTREGPSSPYTYDWTQAGPVATLASDWSGITLDIYSDQEAFQLYTCNGMNGSMPLKSTQGLFGNNTAFPRTVPQYGCVVMEVEDWIDAINYPEWGRDSRQIFGPGDAPYSLQAVYKFSVNGTTAPPGGMTLNTPHLAKRNARPYAKREL